MDNKEDRETGEADDDISVESTMAGPLWSRATYSPEYPNILDDPESVKIVKEMQVDFSKVQEFCGEFYGLNFLIRARFFDDKVKEFISSHPNSTVVNMGCGLDTTFSRVDNGKITWYDLDLPTAIEYRKKFIKETGRSSTIACSMFDTSWFDKVTFNEDKGIFFIAAGIFNYFKESSIQKLCSMMAEHFPGGELVFDVPSKFGVKIINRRMRKMGLGGIKMHFGIGNPEKQLSSWSDKVELVDWSTLFSKIPRDPKWKRGTRFMMNLSDRLKVGKYIHLRFSN